MKIKRIRGNVWQVTDTLDDAPMEDDPVRFSVQYELLDDHLKFLRAWAWGVPVSEHDRWMFESWLEEHEDEILDEMEVEA